MIYKADTSKDILVDCTKVIAKKCRLKKRHLIHGNENILLGYNFTISKHFQQLFRSLIFVDLSSPLIQNDQTDKWGCLPCLFLLSVRYRLTQ